MTTEVNKELEAATATIETQKAEMAKLADTVAKLAADLAIAKLSPEEAAFATDKKMTPEELKAFADKDKDERKKAMETDTVAKLDALPESLRKQLAEGQEALALVKSMAEEQAVDAITKRVTEFGAPADLAKSLHAVHKADPAAAAAIESTLKALYAQVKEAGLFKEIGKGGDSTTKTLATGEVAKLDAAPGQDAAAELRAKANELAKAEKISFGKAYLQVTKENPDLFAKAKNQGIQAGSSVSV